MTNPAYQLHDLYSRWRGRIESASSPLNMASVLGLHRPKGTSEVRQAFALIAAIERLLASLAQDGQRVAVFQRQLDDWARVPLSLSLGWSAAADAEGFVSKALLDQIEGFGAFLDGKVPVLTDAHEESLRSLVDRADALLTEEGLDPALKRYLRRLLFEIRFALDDEVAGMSFNFAEAVQRLWVAFEAAAAKAPQAQRPRWRSLADQILVGVASGGVVEAASITLQAISASN